MIPNHKGEIPVALLLLPFVLGILTGLNLGADASVNLLLAGFAVCTLAFVLLNLKYNTLNLYKYRWAGGLLISFLLFLFGWILPVRWNELHAASHFSKRPARYLAVKINGEPVLKNGLFRFTGEVEQTVDDNGRKTTATGTLLISIRDTSAKRLNYGDELLIPAKYNVIDPPFNPAEFNYKSYLAHKNIFYQAYLYPGQYALLKNNSGNRLIAYAILLRQNLVQKLRQNIRDTGAYAVASAMILGYRADLGNDILEAYSKTGAIYVLTVSGAQVAIIYLVLAYSLSFLDRFKHGKIIKAIIIIGLVWYYALLTGFSVAVCRAALMLSLVLIGKTSRRYINTLNILAASAFLLLCYDPLFITEAGFQLSYLAVFGVIILRPVIYKWLSFKSKTADKIWALCSFSIAIQLAIFPLCAFYFHQFPVYFLMSNLFVIVPSAIIMYAGVFFLLLPKIPLLSLALAFVLEKTVMLMNNGLAAIEHLPGAVVEKIWLASFEYLLLYAIISSIFYFGLTKRTASIKIGLFGCLLLSLSLSIKNIRQAGSKTIAWLNLEKHVGIVFKNDNSAIILTDLKETDKAYKYSIQPYLDSCGVSAVKIYGVNDDINSPWLRKKLGFIQFADTRTFIWNRKLDDHALPQRLKINFIYATGNPGLTVNAFENNFDCQTLIVDGSNADKRILDWQKQLSAKSINYWILKRNKSIISLSN
jgi:competence protein ComEC